MKYNHLWKNLLTGELLTHGEAVAQAMLKYYFTAEEFDAYYVETDMEVSEDWDEESEDLEPNDIDSDEGFDPYEGCFTWDC